MKFVAADEPRSVDELGSESLVEVKRAPVFCLELFSEYQNRMSRFLLLQRAPLKEGPIEPLDDPTCHLLTGQEAVFLGPNAFLTFLLIHELESMSSAPRLTSSTICQLLNRHQSSGAQLIKRILSMASKQGLLSQEKCQDDLRIVSYSCSKQLRSVLEDVQRSSNGPVEPSLSEGFYDARQVPLDSLNLQIKRAYLAHKSDQLDYVLETTAAILKALRRKEDLTGQNVLDQKILLLNLRARALLLKGRSSASNACLVAAIKCMAISATRHPLPA